MKPLIGITTTELRPGGLRTLSRSSGVPHDETFLGMTYFRAIERAGGLPVMLAPGDPALAEQLVERLDGLLMPGGPDIHPSFYGHEPHAMLGPTWPEADRFELAVARAAMDSGMPILGICRGAQVINVVRGGTMHQHVDGARQAEAADVLTQRVRVLARTRLHGMLLEREVSINSFHHQAIDRLGAGLRVSARWGRMIKAIEAPGHPFLIGVQWHPEAIEDDRLFTGLVAAAGHEGLHAVA